ncbi:efflux RND transporter periplasmic adaptor subunit [Cytophagaceae bacterium DM2B3-1]|uniref:Efflux RND transporter periplasmic adaptor subunit n=1 Tax=Xanthocytophaga flava TaxID=3048013 RepID=A0ABT7CWY6_9BACT|nr:efflux RND transporter periplasmic adaptor subunit [Xanthocytophaga flavus]MDJ1498233.1 efflux RND transporter periplasmic adaptor subunit [Xanthocytophaga flavus]
MKVKYIVYAIVIISLGVLVAYRIIQNKKKDEATASGKGGGKGGASRPVQVSGVVATPQRFSDAIAVSGSLDANEQVQIRSQVSGLVKGIYFKEGSIVKEGQLLIQIDNQELEAQLSQALTREKLSAANEERSRKLLAVESISQQEYDVALADFRALQAQTRLIRAQLEKTQIRAPFTGTIGLRAISVGEYLSSTTTVANLVNTNPVKVTFSVPEKYMNQLKVNTEVHFTVAGSEKKYTARVYAIEPRIDVTTRTLQLRALADNPKGELLPGAFTSVELPLTTINDAILIPTEAIVPIQDGKKVFVSENGKAKEVKVETSTRREKDILITSGLHPGDTVLTSGVMSLKPESPVRVVIDTTR